MKPSNWFKVRKVTGLTLFWGGVIFGFYIMVTQWHFTLGSVYADSLIFSTVPVGFIFWVSTWD